MKITTFLLSIILLVGCTIPKSPTGEEKYKATDAIRYTVDRRTGICFAVMMSRIYSGYQVFSISSVPCTPEVMAESLR